MQPSESTALALAIVPTVPTVPTSPTLEAPAANSTAVVAVADSPLRAPHRRMCMPGQSIAATEPQPMPGSVHICRLNGQWLSRQDWHWTMEEGDIVEWYEVPGSRNTIRGLLQIAVVFASIYYPPLWFTAGTWQAAAAAVAINVAGNLAINALLPIQQQGQQTGEQPSPTYSTSLSGNTARLYAPIPKICGTHLCFPPFAAQPYFEFVDNEQYYRAVFCVGIGQHTIVRQFIDDTDLNRFTDVLVARYLPPGSLPTEVLANVVTAPEVSGGELKSGIYQGGFAACGPRTTASSIGIDVMAPRGLSNLSVTWRVESRPVDDFGAPLAPWGTLATETRTANTNTAQRWSNKYTINPAARVEVRVVRTDTKNEDPAVAHEIQWVGMRAYLANAAPLNANAAHYELVIRASEQLSGSAQRRFGLLVAAHARTWSPAGGWSAPVATRNPFWWLADLWSSTTWGESLPDDRIDLQSLYELAIQADARQDRFDYVFDQTIDAWEAAQLVARAGRARVFRRAGAMRTVARDQLDTLPVTAFSPRNCQPESMTMVESLRTRESPDGVIIEYFDNRKWDWEEILQPLPGVTEVTKPVMIRLPGVTGLQHARREAAYEAAALAYRTRSVSCVTEMQGMLPAYLQTVAWQPDIQGYGSSGDIVQAQGLALTLSEPIPAGASTITLIRDDGTLWGPHTFASANANTQVVTLATQQDFTINTTGSLRERTKYLIGSAQTPSKDSELVRIASISDGGRREDVQFWRIDASIDDARVHAADAAYLPTPGVVQDPVDDGSTSGGSGGGGGGGGGGEVALIVDLRNALYEHNTATTGGVTSLIAITLASDGRLIVTYSNALIQEAQPGQWLAFAPVTEAQAGNFSVRATLVEGTVDSGTLDTLLPLNVSRTWQIETSYGTTRTTLLHLEIYDQDDILQDSADITLLAQAPLDEGGGGA